MPLALRPAEPADAAEVARLHVRAWQVAYEGLLPEAVLDGLDVELRAARYRFGDPDRAGAPTVIAVDEQGVAGFVTVGQCREDAGVGEVYAIYVDPGHWRRGAGHALMAEARDRLSSLGYREAVLWVLVGNARAERFYRAEGWVADGGRRTEQLDACWVAGASEDPVAVDEVRYRTTLS